MDVQTHSVPSTLAVIRALPARVYGACEAFTAGRWWLWKTTLLATATSLLLAFPSYDELSFNIGNNRFFWVSRQIEDLPLFWQAYPDTPVVFRLTVPVLAQLLGLDAYGVVGLQFVAGVLLLSMITALAYRITGDRSISLLFAVLVATMHAGATAFVELRGHADGFALCFLVAALYFRHPAIIAASVFLAAFTDERSLIAAGFVFLWWALLKAATPLQVSLRSLVNGRSAAVVVAGVAYLLVRAYLGGRYNIATSAEQDLWQGVTFFGEQINNMPMGIWTGLEGGWGLVALAGMVLFQRNRLGLFLYSGLLLLVSFLALSVVDITRSMAYLLPSLPIALLILKTDQEGKGGLRHLVLIACVLSLLWPAYIAGGKTTIWWQYPLPLQFVRWFLL